MEEATCLASSTPPSTFFPDLQELTHRVDEIDMVHKVPLSQIDSELGRRGTGAVSSYGPGEHTPKKMLTLPRKKP